MQKEMEKRPNILLITTDTQRVDTLRCMGYPEAVSPNLDRLAEEGILFERAYTAAPACMTARCCLMTGLYSPLHGCIENGIERQEQLPMLTDELKKLGYKTMMFGKTHYGKIQESFDVVETVNGEKGQERNDFYTKYFETNGYSQKFHRRDVPVQGAVLCERRVVRCAGGQADGLPRPERTAGKYADSFCRGSWTTVFRSRL